MSEQSIVKACLQYLTLKGVFHYRQNTGAYKTERGGFVRFGATGSPDIICVIGGKYIGLEVKQKSGKQSESQKIFQKQLEQAGGGYHIIRDVEELINLII